MQPNRLAVKKYFEHVQIQVTEDPKRVIVPQLSPLTLPNRVTIGGIPATVNFAGIVAGAIGLYQFNIVIPGVAAADQPIQLTLNGVANAQDPFIPIGQ